MAEKAEEEKRLDDLHQRAAKGGRAGRGKGCGKGSKPNDDKRDEKGVRKNTYSNNAAKGQIRKIDPALTECLCDMMKRGIFGEEEIQDGQRIRRNPRQPRGPQTVDELIEKTEAYIDYINEHRDAELMPDVEGYALWLGVDRQRLTEWERTKPPEYADIIKATRNAIAAYKKQLGLAGKIPPVVFAIDFNNNHGYTQGASIQIDATPSRLQDLPTRDEIRARVPDVTPVEPEIEVESNKKS